MARLHLIFLFSLVAVSALIVSATDKASTSTATAPTTINPTDGDVGGDVADGPSDDNAIGTTDDDAAATPGDDDVAVAGPIGSDSSYANYPPPQTTSASNSLSATIGYASIIAAMAGLLFFF